MGTGASGAPDTWIARVVSIGKDLISLLRDAALFLLAVLLILFPATFNSILVSAGFEEGSIVSFKWKANLVESNRALEEAQAVISNLQKRNDELVKELTDAKAKLDSPGLDERLAKIEEENRSLRDATREVQTTVSQAIESNLPLVEKARTSPSQSAPARRGPSGFLVGLQTLGVPDDERIAINEKLRAEGFSLDPLTYSYPAGERPSWFAARSTVFYYASSALPAAQQLAGFLKTVTGQEFAVQRGAGLGVDPSRRDTTLFVHYIRS